MYEHNNIAKYLKIHSLNKIPTFIKIINVMECLKYNLFSNQNIMIENWETLLKLKHLYTFKFIKNMLHQLNL